MPTIALPTKNRTLEPYVTSEPIVFPSKEQTQSFNRIAYAAAHVVADPLADYRPVGRHGHRLGEDHRVSALSVGPRPRRRRSDGHSAARRRARMDRGEATDRPCARRCQDPAGRENLLRRRHRSSRSRDQSRHRRDHPRVRGADRSNRGARRQAGDHGEPRPGARGQNAAGLCEGLRSHPPAGQRAGHHPLAGRNVRPRARRLLGLGRSCGGDGGLPRTSSATMPQRSTA